jgi:hypothetical protein
MNNIINFNKEKQSRVKIDQEQRMITDGGTKISVKHTINKQGHKVIQVLKIREEESNGDA